MLLASWEVRTGKNCDRGLENAARGRGPRAAFSSPRSQFFTIRTDPKPDNNMFIFFSCGKLAHKWFCLRNFVIGLRAVYKPFVKKIQKANERVFTKQRKIDVLKNRFISNYFMLVAFSLPVKFSKSVFSGVKFRAKFEVVLQKQFLSVVTNHSKSDFSTVN